MDKKRIIWVDIAKGIGILLTILGHTVGDYFSGSIVRGIVFSFHMPLFFVLSGYTNNKPQDDSAFLSKNIRSFKRLIIPSILVFVIMTVWQVLSYDSLPDLLYLRDKLYTLVFASGVSLTYNDLTIAPIGIPWFLFALFLCRAVYDYINVHTQNNVHLAVFSFIIGTVGILFGRLQWLPFSLDIAMAAVPFLFFGDKLKKTDFQSDIFKSIFVYFTVWIITLYLTFPDYTQWTYLELATRRYTLFPICYVCAIAGTMLVSRISVMLEKVNVASKLLAFLGRHSLLLLCIHAIDGIYDMVWSIPGQQFLTAASRIVTDVMILCLLVMIVWLKGRITDRLIEKRK